jgi:amidohydrolase
MPALIDDTLLTLQAIAKEAQLEAVFYRRYFHQHPELSWKEDKTLSYLKEKITAICRASAHQTEIKEYKGGLIVDLKIATELPTVLFRADMDALPIEENTLLSFSSRNPGVMHSCGHDFHMAMLLVALKIIASRDAPPKTNLRFVFQRAEETGLSYCGGKVLVEEGTLDSVQKVFGLHISSTLTSGIFFSNPEALLANSTLLDLVVTCSGGHVMRPHQGSNAIDILADILLSLRGIEKKLLFDKTRVTVVPSVLNAGKGSNVRPNIGKLSIAIRNFLTQKELDLLIDHIYQEVERIIDLYPTAHLKTFSLQNGYPALVNDKLVYESSKNLISKGLTAQVMEPLFAGEDFSYYLQKKPGCYWILGAKQGSGHDHHTAEFNPDESILWKGVYFWLILAYEG